MLGRNVSVICVVDDEEQISKSLAMILHHKGFAVSSFTNSLKALEHVRATPTDLLISDVVMPQLSGIDLAIQVKKFCPACKILLFSGQAATADLLGAARSQGHNFHLLSKPIHPTDLLREIDELEENKSAL
jgi:DNA-binding NtrC family response regulator